MIRTDNQDELATWLCEKIGLAATAHLRCLGSYSGSQLLGVVGFDQFNGASLVMHAAGSGYWLNREMLRAVFHYPFEVCKVNMLIGFVPSGNTEALRFNKHIGFHTEVVLDGAHPDGALVMMTMHRSKCRYLQRNRDGQEEQAATTT